MRQRLSLSIPATFALILTVGLHAFDQQPSTKPPVAPAQAAPGPDAAKAQRAAPGKTVQNGQQQVKLIFSPRTRYCAESLTEKSSEIAAKKVCFTASDLWGRRIGTARLLFVGLLQSAVNFFSLGVAELGTASYREFWI